MNVVVASERLNILGGVWTPKLISSFQEGDVSHPFHVEGRVEIKELGGHMKLFMTDMSIEPHPLNLLEEDKEEIKTEYRKQFQLKIEHMIETGEDPPLRDTKMLLVVASVPSFLTLMILTSLRLVPRGGVR